MKHIRIKKPRWIFVVLFILLMIAPFFIKNINYIDYFEGSLLPEFTGVILEFIIILYIIDHLQKKNERQNKVKAEKRLREMFIFFFNTLNKHVPENYRVGKFYGSEHEKNSKELMLLKGYIETHGLAERAIKDIRIHCKNDIDLFNSFVPVVATLEEKHLKAWMRISYYMNAIITERETTQDSVIKIIEKIQLFDDESFSKKLIVD
ncbi:TPA: hypothetical protein MX214_003939 [Citrobacter sedlakii]|nr:hypothetical protein [Citrobacter sedlakii]HCA7134059.1 hypothetical protein [Citrobacter sedlakii]HCA7180193.1 hypothetical protein [Citrobacter sedlakii]